MSINCAVPTGFFSSKIMNGKYNIFTEFDGALKLQCFFFRSHETLNIEPTASVTRRLARQDEKQLVQNVRKRTNGNEERSVE